MLELRKSTSENSLMVYVFLNDKRMGLIYELDGCYTVSLYKNPSEIDVSGTFGSYESAKNFVTNHYEVDFPEFINAN